MINIAKPLKTRGGKPVYNVRTGADGKIFGLILDWGTMEWLPCGTHIYNVSGEPHRNDLVSDEVQQ